MRVNKNIGMDDILSEVRSWKLIIFIDKGW